jgi:putative ABC transport system permease protein
LHRPGSAAERRTARILTPPEEDFVRYADILGLALAALWQQKTRTLLTTLGVVFGSLVLAASLSIGHGVQETIERESHRSDFLRRVEVRAQWRGRETDIPADELQVKGEMSDDRRERIRKALLDRRLRFNPDGPQVKLTRDLLRSLAQIEHVEAVMPTVRMYGWAVFGGRSQATEMVSAKPDNGSLWRRVLAGRCFAGPDERSALVSEFLLYQLGVADDSALIDVVGKKLRLEFRVERQGAGLTLYLTKSGGGEATREETSALDKVKKQLPEALDKFALAAPEKDALRRALRERPPRTADVYATELTIAGVLRQPTAEDQKAWWDMVHADVVLPLYTAEDLFFRAPAPNERGVDTATLFVDREQNVKEVIQRVLDTGLDGFGRMDYIERERLTYLLIFGGMTCVAGVALLVAALGIANTMLMSVLERTREVGIMKAVGAGDGHVQLVFLLEGAIIGLLGGGVGLLLAWAASIPGDRWVRSIVMRDMKIELKEALFIFPPWLLAVVMLFAVIVTTLAAVYPARRAAKVNPVTALRHE